VALDEREKMEMKQVRKKGDGREVERSRKYEQKDDKMGIVGEWTKKDDEKGKGAQQHQQTVNVDDK